MAKDFEIFRNKEISQLDFNKRVLLQAKDVTVPLCERLKFLKIFNDNLDEFFMTKVASLQSKKMANKSKGGLTPSVTYKEPLNMVLKKAKELVKLKDCIYFKLIKDVGKYIEKANILELNSNEFKYVKKVFNNNILPLISPQIVGKYHPFPFLKNKGTYVYINLFSKKNKTTKIGILQANGCFGDVIIIPKNCTGNSNKSKLKFVLVEDVILYFADKFFNKYKVKFKVAFRVTRKAEINIDKEVGGNNIGVKQTITNLLEKRKTLPVVRLEVNQVNKINKIDKMSYAINYLAKKLKLQSNQIFLTKSPLSFSFVPTIVEFMGNYKNANLFYPKIKQKKPANMAGFSIVDLVLNKDVLLLYPFYSMDVFTNLLAKAAEAEDVASIKITLYRVAPNSKIVYMLKKAAENGKDVLVVVELKAKFDEQNNMNLAMYLEKSGCKVIYGLSGYKIHAKILLITKKNNGKITYISQVGTGNYNEVTAKNYTDISFITSNKIIGMDILNIFNNISVGTLQESAAKIITSPIVFKTKFLKLIDDEIKMVKNKQEAQIIIKCNSLSDKDIMLKLVEASQAGVKIKLIVRGICCLLPGVKGYTENIEVISIVGRFLEHSRIFLFGSGCRSKVYISSADLMVRNTTKRVEVTCPIEDEELKNKLCSLLNIYVKDNVLASKLTASGKYKKVVPKANAPLLNSQDPLFYTTKNFDF